MGIVVGIDLGTTNSVLAVRQGNETKVIVNSEGSRLTPSVVAFTDDGRLVGRAAKAQSVVNPKRTISSVKRLMGKRRSECASDEKRLPYELVGDGGDPVKIRVDGKDYFPQEISSMILADLKKSGEAYLGCKITDAVISVPARFSDSERNATKEAAEICGLRVLRIINEPTAAALAYGFNSEKTQHILVTDPGGGTADNSIICISSGVFEVISTAGDCELGGDDFDHAIFNFVADEFLMSSGIDIRRDPLASQRALEACEKAKCDLSSSLQTTINLPYIALSGGVPKHLSQVISRSKFEQLCAPLLERLRIPIIQVLEDAKLQPSQIDEVVLVGGTSRIPKFQEMVSQIFNGKTLHKGIHPDEAIALGSAIQGSVLSGETTDLVLLDVTPLSLGLETLGGVTTVLVPRNTTIPTSKTELFSTASDNQPAVDIHVLQGERRMASGNRTLGRFQMTGIPLQPRGKPQIEVLFDIDANGILNVSAKDKNTGKEHKVEIKGSSGLEKSDIDRMVKDAAAYEAEDKNKADLIETRNKADGLLYGTETFMRENTKSISAACHATVKTAVDTLRTALDGQDTKIHIEARMDALEVANKRMYDECFAGAQKVGQAAPATKPSVAGAPDGEVIEAKFEF